jgi:hypothetical protein
MHLDVDTLLTTVRTPQAVAFAGIVISFVFLSVAFVLQLRAVQRAEREPLPLLQWDAPALTRPSTPHRVHPSVALAPLFLVIAFGLAFNRITYYDYFVDRVLFWPLFAICTTAMFAAMLFNRGILESVSQWWQRILIRLVLLVFTGLFAWGTLTILPGLLADGILALRTGPEPATGHIEALSMTDGRRPVARIVVDGVRYETFDVA